MALQAFGPLRLVLNFLLLPLFLYSQGPQGSSLTAYATSAAAAARNRDALGALKGHNYVRNNLGLPALTWNTTLALDAQVWANHLAKIDQLVHSTSAQRPGQGENLYFYYNSATRAPYPMTQATFAFVSEITQYHGEVIPQGNFEGYGHYTQVVWKDTKQVGVATYTNPAGKQYVVARYSPPGNVVGQKPY